MPLYDFKCPSGHVTERLKGYGVESIPCPYCCAPAHRRGYNTVSVELREAATEVKDKDGRVNVTRFKEASEEVAYGYEKAEQREGVKIKSPNLYKAGLREAKRKGAKLRV